MDAMRSGAMWRTSFAIVEAMIDPVVVLRPLFVGEEIVDFVFVAANEAAETQLGFDGDTVVGSLLTEVMPAANDLALVTQAGAIATTGTPQRIEVTLADGDHERQWEYTGVAYGAFILVIARDVTHRRERDRAQAEVETLKRITAERERVARDLHDSVIQQVIGASMVLARVAGWAEQPVAGELEHVISIHDDIVRELRSILFGLQRPVRDLDGEIASVVDQATAALGFAPQVSTSDLQPIQDNQLVAAHMLLTLREVLSNIARHAGASSVWVEVHAVPDHLTMTVSDDGCGIADPTKRGRGLDNLGARASLLGGSCDITRRPEGGTVVCWSVPLQAADMAPPDEDPGGIKVTDAVAPRRRGRIHRMDGPLGSPRDGADPSV